MIIQVDNNKNTRFTRMCIAEAIIKLLKSIKYEKIKISDIAKKAGVSRMTFYKYYESTYDALTDYLNIIISEYVENSEREGIAADFFELKHICYSLIFFDKYADFFLTLSQNGLHSIMLDGINCFLTDNIQTSTPTSKYKLYSYSGGLLNSFLKWEENGKEESAEQISEMLYNLYRN